MPADVTPSVRAAHWEAVYGSRGETQLSWHQDEPALSLALVRELCPGPDGGRIIDVGGGTSLLACRLAEAGYEDVTVLDVSNAALLRAQVRCGDPGRRVRWQAGDVTRAPLPERVDLWHDRAAFHFLVDPRDRRRYVARAAECVRPGGYAVVATFATDGPPRCSGLPVRRYDAAGLAAEFAPAFSVVKSTREMHVTPWGQAQSFVYVVLRRGTARMPAPGEAPGVPGAADPIDA